MIGSAGDLYRRCAYAEDEAVDALVSPVAENPAPPRESVGMRAGRYKKKYNVAVVGLKLGFMRTRTGFDAHEKGLHSALRTQSSDAGVSMLKACAALGFRVHSGWAAMIALAGPVASPCVIQRRRIEIADRSIPGSVQPYHAAEPMTLRDAQKHLERCSEATTAVARKAMRDSLMELSDYQVQSASILLASARPLPGLAAILASHALIHTAEGEFYRAAIREACEHGGLIVSGIKERELAAEAGRVIGRSIEDIQFTVAGFGKLIGPPWRQDEKLSALAAWLALARRS